MQTRTIPLKTHCKSKLFFDGEFRLTRSTISLFKIQEGQMPHQFERLRQLQDVSKSLGDKLSGKRLKRQQSALKISTGNYYQVGKRKQRFCFPPK